ALSTARQVSGMGVDNMERTRTTPEERPLGVFGATAGRGVAELLGHGGIRFMGGSHAEVGHDAIVVHPGPRRLRVQLVVSLPRLVGIRIPGVPANADAFVWTTQHGRVVGLDDVYAAGDMTEFPIKQGGLAAQQADA